MTFRTIAREIKDYPATACLSLAWVLVFAAMSVYWVRSDPYPTWGRFLISGMGTLDPLNEVRSAGHRFGDLSLAALRQGEVWRLITCNFVHYSLIHIAMNLVAFYVLGTVIESWYGGPQFMLIYVLTGGLGNLFSAVVRGFVGFRPLMHSAGGSVVVMGLIGLCAIVGWRSRSAPGTDMGWQMIKAIGLTAILGIVFHRYIDNWGHAGGAVVGLCAGSFHRAFLRRYRRPAAWTMGLAASFVIVASALAQVADDLREAPARQESLERLDLQERLKYDRVNRSLQIVALLGERRLDPRVVIRVLQIPENIVHFGVGATAPPYHRALAIARAALTRRLTDEEQAEFDQCAGRLGSQILTNCQGIIRQESTADDFDQLKALMAVAESRKLADEENDQIKARLAPILSLVQQELEQRIRAQWGRQRDHELSRTRPRGKQARTGPSPGPSLSPSLGPR